MEKSIKVVVLCENSMGEREFYTCAVNVTQEQYENGIHYDLAEDDAANNGYEPKFSFDCQDYASKQLGEVLAWI